MVDSREETTPEKAEAESAPKQRGAFGKIFGAIDKGLLVIEEFVLAWGIILLAILLIANVVGRSVFNHSLMFVEEVSQAIVVLVTFLGLGYCTRKARHIRMSAIYDLFGPKTRKGLIILMAAVTATTMALMGYWSFHYVLKVKQFGNVTPTLRFPMWYVYMWVPIGFFMAALEYLMTIYKNIREKDVYLSIEVPDEYEEELIAGGAGTGDDPACRMDEKTRIR